MAETATEAADASARRNPDLAPLDDALTALEKLDPRQARTVELRFFGGLSLEEVAEVCGGSGENTEQTEITEQTESAKKDSFPFVPLFPFVPYSLSIICSRITALIRGFISAPRCVGRSCPARW